MKLSANLAAFGGVSIEVPFRKPKQENAFRGFMSCLGDIRDHDIRCDRHILNMMDVSDKAFSSHISNPETILPLVDMLTAGLPLSDIEQAYILDVISLSSHAAKYMPVDPVLVLQALTPSYRNSGILGLIRSMKNTVIHDNDDILETSDDPEIRSSTATSPSKVTQAIIDRYPFDDADFNGYESEIFHIRYKTRLMLESIIQCLIFSRVHYGIPFNIYTIRGMMTMARLYDLATSPALSACDGQKNIKEIMKGFGYDFLQPVKESEQLDFMARDLVKNWPKDIFVADMTTIRTLISGISQCTEYRDRPEINNLISDSFCKYVSNIK